jgi:hypothetical protein
MEKRMDGLDEWKKSFTLRIDENQRRLNRLKMKYGME